MARLWGRTASLIVDTLDISLVDYTARVVKSLKPEPNTMDLKVFNLNEDHRTQLQNKGKFVARLEIGYGNQNQQVFLGEIRSCGTEVDGSDKVTQMTCGDGETEIQKSRCAVTFGPQVSVDTALRSIASTLGVNQGNLSQAIARLQARGVTNLYSKGAAFYGNTWRVMQDFARSAGLEISVQDGQLLILDRGTVLKGKALRLAQDTGLLGSPTVDTDTSVTAKVLAIPDLRPGIMVVFDAEFVKGPYRVYHCEWNVATRGDEWECKITCLPIKSQ